MIPLRRTSAALLVLLGLFAVVAVPATASTAARRATAASCTSTRVLLLSAYPAEIQANLALEAQDAHQPQDVGGHQVYAGTLLGRRVLLALTGEGTKNAHDTTLTLLQHFSCISAVVMSGTAGGDGPSALGDVTVPARWTGDSGVTYEQVDPTLLTGARKIVAEADAQLETSGTANVATCGTATPPVVLLPRTPHVLVGGIGVTDNEGNPGTCSANGGALGGCDPCPPGASAAAVGAAPAITAERPHSDAPRVDVGSAATVAHDEETASAMAVAQARAVPFIAFRAVSDDKLPTPLWLGQYLVYQQIAADNAAVAARLWIRGWSPARAATTPPKKHPTAKPVTTPTKTPTVTRPGGQLAATGLPWVLPLLAAAFLAGAASHHRRRAFP